MIDNFKVNSRFRLFVSFILFSTLNDLVFLRYLFHQRLILLRATIIFKYVHVAFAKNSPLLPFIALVAGAYILPRR